MDETSWNGLLEQIRHRLVVPVLGPQLLVGEDGTKSLQANVADRLLEMYGLESGSLPPFRELNEAVSRLRLKPGVRLQDLYADVHGLIQGRAGAIDAEIPAPLEQLAEIADFSLFVTLTPDGLLTKKLRERREVSEIVHSPKLPSGEARDLAPGWNERTGEAHVLYLFGKSRPAPLFAIHDEDVLEYAHNVIARGSNVPNDFLLALRERSLLLIGCNFPDWLSRFFLRVTNRDRLSGERDKREWLIEALEPEASLTAFLQNYSRDTQVLSQRSPVKFVAELHERWKSAQAEQSREADDTSGVPASRGTLFFVSYSRPTDLSRAERIFKQLKELGAGDHEIWFDKRSLDPGVQFHREIFSGIETCRHFIPIFSKAAVEREEGFVFKEWRKAEDRRRGMNRQQFVVPVIVDEECIPENYNAGPVPAWSTELQCMHAPDGTFTRESLEALKKILRTARAPSKTGI